MRFPWSHLPAFAAGAIVAGLLGVGLLILTQEQKPPAAQTPAATQPVYPTPTAAVAIIPTPYPTPATATLQPTYTPWPTATTYPHQPAPTARPTLTPYPTHTPYPVQPTYAPLPTPTSYPPQPTYAPQPQPTVAPQPTPTPQPTIAAVDSRGYWRLGDFYNTVLTNYYNDAFQDYGNKRWHIYIPRITLLDGTYYGYDPQLAPSHVLPWGIATLSFDYIDNPPITEGQALWATCTLSSVGTRGDKNPPLSGHMGFRFCSLDAPLNIPYSYSGAGAKESRQIDGGQTLLGVIRDNPSQSNALDYLEFAVQTIRAFYGNPEPPAASSIPPVVLIHYKDAAAMEWSGGYCCHAGVMTINDNYADDSRYAWRLIFHETAHFYDVPAGDSSYQGQWEDWRWASEGLAEFLASYTEAQFQNSPVAYESGRGCPGNTIREFMDGVVDCPLWEYPAGEHFYFSLYQVNPDAFRDGIRQLAVLPASEFQGITDYCRIFNWPAHHEVINRLFSPGSCP